MQVFHSKNEEETENIGESFSAQLSSGSVVAMSIGGVLCQEFGVPVMLLVATGCHRETTVEELQKKMKK